MCILPRIIVLEFYGSNIICIQSDIKINRLHIYFVLHISYCSINSIFASFLSLFSQRILFIISIKKLYCNMMAHLFIKFI